MSTAAMVSDGADGAHGALCEQPAVGDASCELAGSASDGVAPMAGRKPAIYSEMTLADGERPTAGRTARHNHTLQIRAGVEA